MYRVLAVIAIIGASMVVSGSVVLAQGAPFCRPGQSPAFDQGFLALKILSGAPMGDPIECPHANDANGDVLQQTSTGLAFWRKSTNTPTFTNGTEHWALVSDRIVYWTGSSVDPPATVAVAPPAPAAPPPRIRLTAIDYFPTDRELPPGFVYQPPDTVTTIRGGQVVERSYARADASVIRLISALVESRDGAALVCQGQVQSWRDRGLVVLDAPRYGTEAVGAIQKVQGDQGGLYELRAILFREGQVCAGLIWIAPEARHNNEQLFALADSMLLKARTYPDGVR